MLKPSPKMAGYIVGHIVWAKGNSSRVWSREDPHGPAIKQYELGIGKPNVTFVVKFASTAYASQFYQSEGYTAWRVKYVDGKLGRDLRIIEAQTDLFESGKAYWLGPVYNVKDVEKFGKYLNKAMETVVPDFLALKYAGPSSPYEEGLKLVPSKEDANSFIIEDMTCNQGIFVVAEIMTDAETVYESDPYASALLASIDADFTTAEKYAEQTKSITETVVERDVRIIVVE
ncbi:hypothetical protein THAOC_00499 [Thalassiosira oceanica]|uniref:DUF1330 domain-containing protein n=1 Tax=Thalassiosira oceanica TaxID=159749 RepID=K0TKA4_THAOC|nr:hypothetical protein THAOC_00499 [Thalassiosira oceanica]|eukprot:EJK77654.1 hypothetical protein THAOC_00499 [Thalassiosira oceanica]